MKKAFLFLVPFTLMIYSCQQENEVVPSGNNNNNDTISLSSYYLNYTDNGSQYSYEAIAEFGSYGDILTAYNNGDSLYVDGLSYDVGLNFGEHLYFNINLPLDSSRLVNLPLNVKYIINDSVYSFLRYVHLGTITYEKVTSQNGKDVEVRENDNSVYYNKIIGIYYIGNHRYEPIDGTIECDFNIIGEFKMRVHNDITNQNRVIENGSYRIKVSVLAL